jgi:carbonic anhydrase
MSNIRNEIIAANVSYKANFGDKGRLKMPPARGFAILTCMDARLDPEKFAGLAEGDAHVIRNAGGRRRPAALPRDACLRRTEQP